MRFAGLRLAVSGAAPLATEVVRRILDLTGRFVFEGYGLTEAAPTVTSTLMSEVPKPGSVGRPVPGVQVRLVDSSGAVVEADDPGEIEICGDNLFSGYWPDGHDGPDEYGWWRTGRSRDRARQRRPAARRPPPGADPGQRLQRLSPRGGGRAADPSRHCRGCRLRDPASVHRRGGEGSDRAARRVRRSRSTTSLPTPAARWPASRRRPPWSSSRPCRARASARWARWPRLGCARWAFRIRMTPRRLRAAESG